ncbi:hypothetical protein RBH20_20890 [Haloarcula sp. H-GB4]|nr:hypothetical protein [Haloarcula sp. H-GB4]MDQ2074980.1 hypothetical protein [Haloarcula sp. H-GB4]
MAPAGDEPDHPALAYIDHEELPAPAAILPQDIEHLKFALKD